MVNSKNILSITPIEHIKNVKNQLIKVGKLKIYLILAHNKLKKKFTNTVQFLQIQTSRMSSLVKKFLIKQKN